MNDDIYAEWLVKRKNPPYRIPVILALSVLFLISLILLAKSSWGYILLAAVVFGGAYILRFLKIEYEYVFVTNELTIDRIFSQSVRKSAVKVEMENVESVELTNAERNKAALQNKGLKLQDFTSHEKDAAPSYTIRYTDKGVNYLLIFEPNEKLLKAMWRCSPSKVRIG